MEGLLVVLWIFTGSIPLSSQLHIITGTISNTIANSNIDTDRFIPVLCSLSLHEPFTTDTENDTVLSQLNHQPDMPLDSLEPVSPLSSSFSQSSSGSMNNIPSTSGSDNNSSVDGLSSNIHPNSSQIYISSGSESENEESETSYIPKHIRTKKVFKHSKQHPPDPDDLPPCRVCGERASGLHYGVNTCEPCKVSFYQQLSLNHML